MKATISYKDKATKELEERMDDLRKLHWDKEKASESVRRDLERKSYEQYEEAEKLRRSLTDAEFRAKSPEKLRRAHEDLERVYASLQHQYQVGLNIGFLINQVLKMKEDELERTATELEEYKAKLNNYDHRYFPNCKTKTLFH